MNPKNRLQLRLDSIAYEKAVIIAELEDRTLNSQFENFIKKGIEQYEREHGEIKIKP